MGGSESKTSSAKYENISSSFGLSSGGQGGGDDATDLLSDPIGADCKFLVGDNGAEKTFVGHKVIFANASPVFKTMFFGTIPEKGDVVVIPDIEPQIFRKMMELFYGRNIVISSVEDAIQIWYFADKYDIATLVKYCIDFLRCNIQPENVCMVLKFANSLEDADLKNSCKEVISKATNAVLNHSSFLEADLSIVNFILDQDELTIASELDLFTALARYAEAQNQCDLKESVKKIRFLTMTSKEFGTCAQNSSLLTTSESLNILFNISDLYCTTHPMPDGFSTRRSKRTASN